MSNYINGYLSILQKSQMKRYNNKFYLSIFFNITFKHSISSWRIAKRQSFIKTDYRNPGVMNNWFFSLNLLGAIKLKPWKAKLINKEGEEHG